MANIDKTVKSKYPPKQKNVNWIDTSGDEPIMKVFNNGMWRPTGGGGGSDYQSSGSIVKDMIKQGTNFNYGKYAIDIPSLPCFKPEAEWPDIPEGLPDPLSAPTIESILAEGYTTVKYTSSAGVMGRYAIFVVKQTGDNPTVSASIGEPIFTDCEPVVICENVDELTPLTPVRTPTSGGTTSGTTDDEVRVLLAPVKELFGVYYSELNGRPLVVSIMPQGKVYVGYLSTAFNHGPSES